MPTDASASEGGYAAMALDQGWIVRFNKLDLLYFFTLAYIIQTLNQHKIRHSRKCDSECQPLRTEPLLSCKALSCKALSCKADSMHDSRPCNICAGLTRRACCLGWSARIAVSRKRESRL
ncbi:hypothetical protein BDZ89DRAFT_215363 [Hymenopellis radicata]|nr:hypothetical protein BDZ89DRAFT_215363 [Hymenopellis radicata]